jgi:hypothetical protein
LLWPGDAVRFEGKRIYVVLPQGIYPSRVNHVVKWGAKLGTWLAECQAPAGGPCELVLVGHSLGCRLLLEALSTFPDPKRAGTNQIRLLMMMAAAVPVAHLKPGGRLRRAAEKAHQRDVMHSLNDGVLRFAFPPGQQAAEFGVGGLKPEAVGRKGNPHQGLWTLEKSLGVPHGGYWKNPRTAHRLLQLLGIVATPDEKTERFLPEKDLRERDGLGF